LPSVLVSQPVLVLSFALAFGVFGAALVAPSSPVKTQARCIARIFVYAAIAVFVGYVITALHLRFNVTSSMAVGIYRLVPLPKNGVRRGMLVAACAPPDAAELGRRRGYLASGPCASGTEPLLKVVVAAAGDEIGLSGAGVAVNGCLLPNSRPLSHDAAGRRLSSWPYKQFPLAQRQLWLYADNVRSWDSRYWGPVPVADIFAKVVPVLTFSVAPAVRSTTPAVMSLTCIASRRHGGAQDTFGARLTYFYSKENQGDSL
jgi:conjugative transfer signal peptidase TraF